MSDGQDLLDVVADRPRQPVLVSALPGTCLLSPCVDDAGALVGFAKNSVLAWDVSGFVALPITLHGMADDGRAVLMPDGRVENFDGCWANLEEYIEEMFEHERQFRRVA